MIKPTTSTRLYYNDFFHKRKPFGKLLANDHLTCLLSRLTPTPTTRSAYVIEKRVA
jgi:hypothetical protein